MATRTRRSRRGLALLVATAAVLTAAGCEPERPFFPQVRTTGYQVSAGYVPVVGDLDGDGWDDVLWFRRQGWDGLWAGRPTGAFAHLSAPVQIEGEVTPVIGDFGGDAADDLLVHRWDGAPSTLHVMQVGGGVAATRSISLPGRHTPTTLDDPVGKDAVVLGQNQSGAVSVWDPDSGTDDLTPLGEADGSAVGGDYDGDGHGDLFLYRAGELADRVAWGDGAGGFTVQTVRNVTGVYQVLALDADGDGRDDLAFVGDSAGYQPPVNLWFGAPSRTFRRESREAIEGRGLVSVHRSHVRGAADTLVRSTNGGPISWTIDAEGVTRTGSAGSYPGPHHLTALVGRFHDGPADDLLRYDDEGRYPESFLTT